jgi:DNA-binding NarL/FixJ family response regulator
MTLSKARIEVRGSSPQLDIAEYLAVVATGDIRQQLIQGLERERLAFDIFADVDAVFEAREGPSPSLILLAFDDPVSGLLSCIAPVTRRLAPAQVILACSRIERWEVRAALAAGAAGIVLFANLENTLGPCVRAVLGGQTCVPRAHWQQIEPPPLSSREKQILGLVVMGFTNGQIAEQLFLAESTVKSHLSSAFGKLGVRSRNEAVHLILDPERGLGTGILTIGGTPLDSSDEAAQS